jgi:hypothetical protein
VPAAASSSDRLFEGRILAKKRSRLGADSSKVEYRDSRLRLLGKINSFYKPRLMDRVAGKCESLGEPILGRDEMNSSSFKCEVTFRVTKVRWVKVTIYTGFRWM